MKRDEILAANPLADYLRGRGVSLFSTSDSSVLVTNTCPIRLHRKVHHCVTVDTAQNLFHCNDCDKGGSIIDWIALKENITAAEALRKLGGGRNGSKPEWNIVATYDYTDENGALLFQCVRLDPKAFRQRRPDGNGDWIWNLRGVRRVPYRLPEVIKAQVVCVAEGEKNSDDLRKLGFTATTNPMGAGKWRDEYSETLRDKDVLIFGDVGDPDKAGERHTEAVIQSLTGKARSIKRVTLPDGFHDVSDYIESFPSLDEAKAAVTKLIAAAQQPNRHVVPIDEPQRVDPPQTGEVSDEETIARLAGLPLLEYDRICKDEAKKLGCRESTLESLVKAKRLLMRPTSDGDNLQGTAVKLADVEPWPEAVNGAEILDAIANRFENYAVLPEGAADMLPLWSAHTHVYKLFQISPRLNISAPTQECGKTTLRNCVSLFCARAVRTDNMTTAVMFRLVSGHSPTILADECDKWLFINEELRGLICSGHEKGGAVMRCEGDSNELRKFGCYAPFVLAAIGALPSQLHSRSICIRLERATREEIKKRSRFDLEHVEYEMELNRKLARWTTDNRERIRSCDPKLPEHLFNRIADNWRVLFAIAEVAGGDWPQRCADALVKLTTREDQRESLRVMLLVDIQQVFTGERMFSKDLVEQLAELKERPWPEICRGKPITERWLARNLVDFGIHPKLLRIGEGNPARGYELADFGQALSRYLPDTGDSSVTPLQCEGKRPFSECYKSEVCNTSESDSYIGDCNTVTLEKGEQAKKGESDAEAGIIDEHGVARL
jgi:5S rRNA maturation endonuclease (ribonuclease M5)